jgi:hypothetical protein
MNKSQAKMVRILSKYNDKVPVYIEVSDGDDSCHIEHIIRIVSSYPVGT